MYISLAFEVPASRWN